MHATKLESLLFLRTVVLVAIWRGRHFADCVSLTLENMHQIACKAVVHYSMQTCPTHAYTHIINMCVSASK